MYVFLGNFPFDRNLICWHKLVYNIPSFVVLKKILFFNLEDVSGNVPSFIPDIGNLCLFFSLILGQSTEKFFNFVDFFFLKI